MEETIIIDQLSPEQYDELIPIYTKNGDNIIPHPALSNVIVARTSDNKIVGMLADVATPMVTMWIDEEYRNQGIWQALVEAIYPSTEGRRTYVIATQPQTVEMCERLKLRKIEFPVYVKDF